MKRGMILFSIAAMLAVLARCQTAMIALDDIPGTTPVCVTNYGPQVVSLTARVTGLEGSSNDWSKTVSNLAALSNNVSALSSSVDATNALFSAWFSGLQSRTSYWDTAYSWGDWHSAVAQKLDIISTNGWETGSHAAFLTGEADLAALRTYHYGSPDIIESPAEWFQFDGINTITGINVESVTNWNIVIPWQIGGVAVTAIGDGAFMGSGVTSIVGAGNVVTVGVSAFYSCVSLASVSLPQVQTVGNLAFAGCGGLTSLYFDNDAPTIGADIFADITPNQVTNYVTNPQATGWGDTLGGMPVVRLPLHTDALTLGGVTHTNWPSADVSGLATTQSVDAVVGDLEAAQSLLSNHTSNGTIGSDGHASSAEKANWNGKLSASGGTASNLTVHGWIAMPQSAPTNLVLRLVCSNEHIIVQEVYQ